MLKRVLKECFWPNKQGCKEWESNPKWDTNDLILYKYYIKKQWKSQLIITRHCLKNKKRQACLIAHLPLPFIIGILTTNPSAVLSNFYIYFLFSYLLIGGNLYVIIEISSFYSVVFVGFPSIPSSPFCLAQTLDILELPAIILSQVTLLDVRKGWNRFEVVSFLPLKYVSHHSPIKIVS